MAINVSIPKEFLARRYSRYYIYLEPVVSDPLIRGYFSFVASLFLTAFLLIFALSPTINTILALQKKIAQQKQTVTQLDTKINALVLAQENYSRVEGSLVILLLALPELPNPQTIISEVALVASASGVTVSAMQFRDLPLSPDQFSPGLGTTQFTLATTGPLDKTRLFLGKIENLPRQIHLTSLVLGKELVNIIAEGYYLPEDLND